MIINNRELTLKWNKLCKLFIKHLKGLAKNNNKLNRIAAAVHSPLIVELSSTLSFAHFFAFTPLAFASIHDGETASQQVRSEFI